MSKKIFVANWKSNKTAKEASEWAEGFKNNWNRKNDVIVCPTFPILDSLQKILANTGVSLGGQNVSPFPSGAYTGEVSAEILKDFVTHCIVGHSERKKYFNEAEHQIVEKVGNLLEVAITPILCVADLEQLDHYATEDLIKDGAEKIIFVYEPPGAISGGGDYHPEEAESIKTTIASFHKKMGQKVTTLYGGSVNPDVISDYLRVENLDGFLVGKASLSPESFVSLVNLTP